MCKCSVFDLEDEFNLKFVKPFELVKKAYDHNNHLRNRLEVLNNEMDNIIDETKQALNISGKNIFLQGWGGRQGETGLLDPNAETATNLGGLFDY